ncbi:hypothetical protein [Streptomyces sp. NPDC048057]
MIDAPTPLLPPPLVPVVGRHSGVVIAAAALPLLVAAVWAALRGIEAAG